MGTRADFYVGRDAGSEWIGSIAWDGHPGGIDKAVRDATDEAAFRTAVGVMLTRDDGTIPERDGWPWPWETSYLTDYVYAFDAGQVWYCSFDHPWHPITEPERDEGDESKGTHDWPLRGGKAQGDIFGPRSGVIVMGRRSDA